MVSINLLPEEILVLEKQKSKKSKINKLTVLILSIMVVITGSILIYSFLKTQEAKKLKEDLTVAEQQVNNYKSQEGYLSLVKKRLGSIKNIRAKENKEVETFNLVDKLLPKELSVTELAVSKDGGVNITAETFSPIMISNLINDFLSPEKNSSKISSLKIDSISRTPFGDYRFGVSTNVK